MNVTRFSAALMSGLAVAAMQVATAPPAAALPGLVKVAAHSPTDSTSPKTVEAMCPAGTRVIGGGGWALAVAFADEAKVLLTRLEPVLSPNGDRYTVTATEIAAGISGSWWVDAYAICAPAPAGHVLVSAATTANSISPQLIRAFCPSGKRVIGTGARIDNSGGDVAIVVTNPFGTAGAEVVSREDANGYAGNWTTHAFAVCADPIAGLATSGVQTALDSQDIKSVTLTCPLGTKVHTAAADIRGTQLHTTSAPDGVAIQQLFPNSTLTKVTVIAVEPAPINADWSLRAEAICGP